MKRVFLLFSVMLVCLSLASATQATKAPQKSAPVDFNGMAVDVETDFSNASIYCDRLAQVMLRDFVQRHGGRVYKDSFDDEREDGVATAVFTVSRVEARRKFGDVLVGSFLSSVGVGADWKNVEIRVALEIYRGKIMLQPPLQSSGRAKELTGLDIRADLGSGWSRFLDVAWSEYSEQERAEFDAFSRALRNLVNATVLPGFGNQQCVVEVYKTSVILSVGRRDRTKEGDRYVILDEPLVNPRTGEILDRPQKATVEVTSVNEKTSTAKVINGDSSKVARGDLIEKVQR